MLRRFQIPAQYHRTSAFSKLSTVSDSPRRISSENHMAWPHVRSFGRFEHGRFLAKIVALTWFCCFVVFLFCVVCSGAWQVLFYKNMQKPIAIDVRSPDEQEVSCDVWCSLLVGSCGTALFLIFIYVRVCCKHLDNLISCVIVFSCVHSRNALCLYCLSFAGLCVSSSPDSSQTFTLETLNQSPFQHQPDFKH